MFTLTCSAYQKDGSIPPKFTHRSIKGKNVSPGFAWKDGPVETKSFAFSIVDPHPVAKNWVHWLAIDIPFNSREIPEGASNTDRMPKGCRELMNTYGEQGYGGPAPPIGTGPHPYVATLYALTVEKLDLPKSASLRQFQNLIAGKVLFEVSLTGFFEQT
ncbi:MAG: YbhB/YbcL family Raf kinase inhibitor-like protein [Bacteroidota bacterium]